MKVAALTMKTDQFSSAICHKKNLNKQVKTLGDKQIQVITQTVFSWNKNKTQSQYNNIQKWSQNTYQFKTSY